MVCSITKRTYARVGLMGNPSDGFEGKTISLSIKNFWVEATIQESDFIELIQHPKLDHLTFHSLKELYYKLASEGFTEGFTILQATCKRFFTYCQKKGIELRKNFRLSYESNIPRQVGLGGSSAIITSVVKCLIQFFDINIPIEILPGIILEVETLEMGINAGLQDRVVQVYEGLIYMDFNQAYFSEHGHGLYQRMLPSSLPCLFLVYSQKPTDSGKIHSDVKQRWINRDTGVLAGMKTIANLADGAKEALDKGDISLLGSLMNSNFDLRRSMYGDAVIGKENLEMIRIGREICNCATKFPGSGGAVLGLIEDETKIDFVRNTYESYGYSFLIIEPIIS